MPVANRGLEAAGLAQLGHVVRLLEQTLTKLGAGSEPGKDVLKAIQALVKHVPTGGLSQGVQNTALQNLVMQQRQMGPQIAAMRQAGAPGAGAPPAAPPGAAAA